jgi:hypothetical protein
MFNFLDHNITVKKVKPLNYFGALFRAIRYISYALLQRMPLLSRAHLKKPNTLDFNFEQNN